MRALLGVAVMLLAVGAPALAGPSPAEAGAPLKETVTVSVVEVPVTVVDRDGNPIRGLTAANFRTFDEGKERPVSAFDSVDFASLDSLTATSPLNPAARRNFMLLFDLTYSSPSSITRAQQAARDFVKKMVQRRDRVAVATIDANRGFRLVSAFTTDRTLLSNAIARPVTFRAADPLQIAGGTAGAELQEGAGSGNGAAATEELNDMLRRMNRLDDQYRRESVHAA